MFCVNHKQKKQHNLRKPLNIFLFFQATNNIQSGISQMENAHNNPKSKTMKNLFSQQPTFSNPPHSSKITLISTPSQNYPSSVNNNSLSQSTKLDKVVGNFSTRASGKIYFNSPSNQFQIIQTQVQTMEHAVKQNLKTLNYRQKLLNIQALIKNSRQLCQQFGYFYITCAMLFYDPFSEIKLSVWVHPDTRVTKCLHPITKKTQYEKQIQFIVNLKLIVKQFFPTIFLGSGKTFTSFLIHIQELKSKLFSKNKKSRVQFFGNSSSNLQRTEKKICLKNSPSNCTLTRKYLKLQIPITQEREDENERKTLKLKQMKSLPNQEQGFYQEKSISVSRTRLDDFAKLLDDEPESPTKINAKIQDQLNNLFGSNDFVDELYIQEKGSQTSNKRSLIQRMANDFNQIF